MLSKINISNYALIDSLAIDFNAGMTSITGETGAGKSIILGALGLTLGDRLDTAAVRNNEKKCIIESTFSIQNLQLKAFFDKHDLDFENESILRREITTSGKSRAFINDTPVSLAILKELSSQLIDVHSQNQTLLLNDERFQLSIIDSLAKNDVLKNDYLQLFKAYKALLNELNSLKEDELKLKSDLDYFTFQLNELKSIQLDTINEKELEQELDLLANAGDVKENMDQVVASLEHEEGVIVQLNEIHNMLDKYGAGNTKLEELSTRINSVKIELDDILAETQDFNDAISLDPEKLETVSEQVSVLKRLHQKHFTNSIEELIKTRDELEEKVGLVNSFDAEIEKRTLALEQVKEKLSKKAHTITKGRKSVAPKLIKEINSLLTLLSMPNATIEINFEKKKGFSPSGIDQVELTFSANKGMPHQPIYKVASGGELSRLMLCIKKVLAENKQLPTIIFDEIDTGVSGDVADKMGELMKEISKSTQIFSITHLPQIASKGTNHCFVYKEDKAGKTYTNIKALTPSERVEELAKMLSGSTVTDAALENAKMLLA